MNVASSRRQAKVIRNLISEKDGLLWPIDGIGYVEIDNARGGVGGTRVHVKVKQGSPGYWLKIPTENL